jgi:N-acetyl-gamma-glutamyl-phosphate reductase
VRAAVAGATGYVGGELLALLSRHPGVRIERVMSSGRAQRQPFPIEESHPLLRSRAPLGCHPLHVENLDPSDLDVVFLATPHEASLEVVPQLVGRGLRVIDLSGAFRLKDARAYPSWYGFEHPAGETLAQAVYGLPEIGAEAIRSARLISNPGCYATSIILALVPLIRADWMNLPAGIVCDSKSGASGAGRAPTETLQFAEVNENCRAYRLFNHRHVPEMLQALGLSPEEFLFTPHLLPVTRGILSTIYVRLKNFAGRDLGGIVRLFREFYAGAPMVRVYPEGALPEISAVAHTNFADLGFALDPPTGRLIIVSALDNLGKGAAGQAVQNMNLMFGFDQETALV